MKKFGEARAALAGGAPAGGEVQVGVKESRDHESPSEVHHALRAARAKPDGYEGQMYIYVCSRASRQSGVGSGGEGT